MIDAELLLVQPSTEHSRRQRSLKRTPEMAEIGSDQFLSRKHKPEHAVGIDHGTDEATQQNGHTLSSHTQSHDQTHFGGRSSTLQLVEPSQSIVYSATSHHDTQDLSLQNIDAPSAAEHISGSILDSTLTNNEELSVESGGDVDPCLLQMPEFSLPIEPHVFPAIYHAMNYSLSGAGV